MENDDQKQDERHAPMWGNGKVETPVDNPASAPGWRDQTMPPADKPDGFMSRLFQERDKPVAEGVEKPGPECMSAPCPEGDLDRDLTPGELLMPIMGVPEPSPDKPQEQEQPPPPKPSRDFMQDGNLSDLHKTEPEPAAAVPAPPQVELPDKPGEGVRAVGLQTVAKDYVCVPVAETSTPPRTLRVVGDAAPAPAAPPPPPPVARRGRLGRAVGGIRGRLPTVTMRRG